MRSQLKKAAAITLMAASLSSFVGCTNANDVSDSSLKQTEPVKQTGEAAASQVRLPAAFAGWDGWKVDVRENFNPGNGYEFRSNLGRLFEGYTATFPLPLKRRGNMIEQIMRVQDTL